jgi:ComF family protein
MRDAIHALKYGHLRSAARRLGQLLALAVSRLAAEAPAEMLVVPVPLHHSKYAERGFNQARLLAKQAMLALRRTHPAWRLSLAPSTVIRLRATENQAGLTPRQRRQNVRGAFVVADPTAVKNKHILLIDDIFTTGATARSIAKVLLRSGAATVWVATLARARRAFDFRGSLEVARDTFKHEETGIEVAEDAPAHEFVPASMHSSPNQPSF